MFTCHESDHFLSKVLAGLMIAVTLVVGVLAHAVAGSQAYV